MEKLALAGRSYGKGVASPMGYTTFYAWLAAIPQPFRSDRSSADSGESGRAPWIRPLLVALILVAGGMFTTASPAVAAAGCHAANCTGLDAVGNGCDLDGVQIDESDLMTGAGAILASIKLYHSTACEANYAVITENFKDPAASDLVTNIFYLPQLGGTESVMSEGGLDSDHAVSWTQLVDGHDSVKACFNNVYDSYLDPAPEDYQIWGSQGQCTKWN